MSDDNETRVLGEVSGDGKFRPADANPPTERIPLPGGRSGRPRQYFPGRREGRPEETRILAGEEPTAGVGRGATGGSASPPARPASPAPASAGRPERDSGGMGRGAVVGTVIAALALAAVSFLGGRLTAQPERVEVTRTETSTTTATTTTTATESKGIVDSLKEKLGRNQDSGGSGGQTQSPAADTGGGAVPTDADDSFVWQLDYEGPRTADELQTYFDDLVANIEGQ